MSGIGAFLEAIRPWLSTGSLVALVGMCGKLWTDNRKLNMAGEGGIRDHYAKEVAALRAQLLSVQDAADLRASRAETRYNEGIKLADERHGHCEEECERLRVLIRSLERQIAQLHSTSLRVFEPKFSLPDAVKEEMRSMEQEAPPMPIAPAVLLMKEPCPPFPEVDQ